MTNLETVYAIHNFEAENDDELSFDIGEPVIVLQKDDGFGDGWWKVISKLVFFFVKKKHIPINS
jgi:hypothetical protein